jgi:Zn-dependent M28 family amino/carboxypeptidase
MSLVTIEVEWQNEVSGPVQVSNVVAGIAGSELPREWVLLGAHLDSWDLGTGAQDNGTGVATVLEAARAIASLGKAPRRSIRFALWAAEEPGPPGSAMFIKRHATEIARLRGGSEHGLRRRPSSRMARPRPG